MTKAKIRQRRPRKKTIRMLEYVASIEHGLKRKEITDLIVQEYGVTKRRADTLYNQYLKEGRELIEKYSVAGRELFHITPPLTDEEKQEKENKIVNAVICSPAVNSPAVVDVNGVTPAERLPTTEEELKQYRYDKVLSPQAKAMRIDMLVEASMKENGIAKMKALEALDEITKLYGNHTDEDEIVFFDVTQTKKD